MIEMGLRDCLRQRDQEQGGEAEATDHFQNLDHRSGPGAGST